MFSQVFVILSPNGGGGRWATLTLMVNHLPPPPRMRPGYNTSLLPSPPGWDQVTTPPSSPPPRMRPGYNTSLPPPGWDQVTTPPSPPQDQTKLQQYLHPPPQDETRLQHLPPPPPGSDQVTTIPPPPPPGSDQVTTPPPPQDQTKLQHLPPPPGSDQVTTPPPPPGSDQVTTPPPPRDYAQAGGTHPTGMHSCFIGTIFICGAIFQVCTFNSILRYITLYIRQIN